MFMSISVHIFAVFADQTFFISSISVHIRAYLCISVHICAYLCSPDHSLSPQEFRSWCKRGPGAAAQSWLAIPVADTMFKACCLPVPHHRVGPGPGDAEPPRRPRQPGARPGARTPSRTTEKYVTERSTWRSWFVLSTWTWLRLTSSWPWLVSCRGVPVTESCGRPASPGY